MIHTNWKHDHFIDNMETNSHIYTQFWIAWYITSFVFSYSNVVSIPPSKNRITEEYLYRKNDRPQRRVWEDFKRFVNCLHKTKTTLDTLMKFWPFLKDHIVRLYRKLGNVFLIFKKIINAFVINGITRRCNSKIWRFSDVGDDQIWTFSIKLLFYLLV